MSKLLEPTAMAQSDTCLTGDQEVGGSIPARSSNMETDHEIFPVVILFLPLIHIGQLSVSGEKMSTSTG